MSPPGHAAVSYLFGRSVRWISLPAVMIGGMLPDIDFVMLPFPWFNQIHRVVTHNLWFVLIAAVIGTLLVPSQRRGAVFIGMLAGGLLHLLVDACMDSNPSNGIGIALFWPVSNYFFSPINLVSISETGPNWNDPVAVAYGFLKRGLIWELPLWGLAIFFWWRARSSESKKPLQTPA